MRIQWSVLRQVIGSLDNDQRKMLFLMDNKGTKADATERTNNPFPWDASFITFMKHTPNLAWLVDEEGTLQYASGSFYRHFGVKEEFALGEKLASLVPEEVSRIMIGKHFEVISTGKPIEFAQKAKWADGTTFNFRIHIFPVEHPGTKRMLGGFAINLGDYHKVEKELKQTSDRLFHLTKATSEAIWEWDMQTGQIFRNEALMEMIGFQPVDSKGISWWLRRIHPEDRNRVADTVKDCTDKNLQTWEDEYRFKCADGNYKHVHDKGYIVYENGLPVKMIGSIQDISELKELENKLIEEKLERQREISETVIRVQEKERTRIGHELHDNVNQILSTVKIFMDLIQPSDQEGIKLKTKCSDYLLLAIEEIRKLSRELVIPQLKTKGLIDSIATIINDINLSGIMKIRFTHDLELEMLGQGLKLTIFRIVQEQVKNMLKHSKAKNAQVLLQRRNNQLQLMIKDDGVGFDAKKVTSGIGLCNIQDRVKFYQGTAMIESQPGKGCALTVVIPIPE